MSAATSRKKKSPKKKLFKWIGIGLLVLVLVVAFQFFGPNTGSFTNGEFLYIRTGATYDDVKKALKEGGFVRDMFSFDLLAKQAGYPGRVGAGKYKINKGMSNYNMVRMLRAHRQVPVKIVINKIRTKQDFIHYICTNLEADSNTLWQMFRDPVYLAQYGLDTNTVMCGILPDTYEFYWNVTADAAFKKIEKNYARFWTDARKAAVKAKNITIQEAIIVASIVEEETNNNPEKGNVASVYLNRLKKGIKLQADPTAKFAYGDFTVKRITSVQTSVASPYNTYYVVGLPPGPICTPSVKTIDAVVFAPATNYEYFCAKGDGSGTHLFAATYQDHLKNAKAYHDLLNSRGIH